MLEWGARVGEAEVTKTNEITHEYVVKDTQHHSRTKMDILKALRIWKLSVSGS
jgi:hypothetical protein